MYTCTNARTAVVLIKLLQCSCCYKSPNYVAFVALFARLRAGDPDAAAVMMMTMMLYTNWNAYLFDVLIRIHMHTHTLCYGIVVW